jgi:hypothetical protein
VWGRRGGERRNEKGKERRGGEGEMRKARIEEEEKEK